MGRPAYSSMDPGSERACRELQQNADLIVDIGPSTWQATWSTPVEPTMDTERAGQR